MAVPGLAPRIGAERTRPGETRRPIGVATGYGTAACQWGLLAFLVMSEAPKARYTVIIACHRPIDRELADSQATGDACIRCNPTDAGELVPVGVVVPPVRGSGIAMACSECVPGLFIR